MAINKAMKAALKALSYPDLKTQQSYPLQRTVINLTHKHLLKPLYRIWDHKLDAGDHEIPMRIFRPEIAGEFPILVFFHGGGWVTGNIDSYDKVCSDLARHTCRTIVSVGLPSCAGASFSRRAGGLLLAARKLQNLPLRLAAAGGHHADRGQCWRQSGRSGLAAGQGPGRTNAQASDLALSCDLE